MAEELKLKIEGTEKPADYFILPDKERGERYFVKDGHGYKEVTLASTAPVRPHENRIYTFTDTKSFISYVMQYGDFMEGIIFFNEKGVKMYFDEISRVEQVSLPFEKSLELRTFLGSGGSKAFTQKAFLKALEMFPKCVTDAASLIPNIERLQISSIVEFESNIDPHNLTFMYQDKAGKQTGTLPKRLELRLPYFEGSENNMIIVADIEIEKPKSETEKPIFTLTDPMAERTERDAVNAEVATISKALPTWMFIRHK